MAEEEYKARHKKAVKANIKGKFGASSPEYGQVSSIKFTRVKAGK